MVWIHCWKCNHACRHDCYISHAPLYVCHNVECQNHTRRRRFDRMLYHRDWTFWLSFSHNGRKEWNIEYPPYLTEDTHLKMKGEDPDGVIGFKMWTDGSSPVTLLVDPHRRREIPQPGLRDVPPGWIADLYHFDDI